jgi:transposase InsO family protein
LRTDRPIEEHILAVRDAHPAWGARPIARYLENAGLVAPAISTVHEILHRHGRVKQAPGSPVASQRFEKPAPNLLWQMDFKGWVALTSGARCHPLTIVDDHSRYAVCIQACANEQSTTVQGHLQTTLRRYGLPEAIFVDNGRPGEIHPDSAGRDLAFGCSSSASTCCTAGPITRKAAARTNASTAR